MVFGPKSLKIGDRRASFPLQTLRPPTYKHPDTPGRRPLERVLGRSWQPEPQEGLLRGWR